MLFHEIGFFRLDTSVIICDPDHPWCGYFGRVIGVSGWISGSNQGEVEYQIQFDIGHPCIAASGTQVEPN